MTSPALARTPSGDLRGVDRGGALRFAGVPFARADRFAPPQPVDPWKGVRDAQEPGPAAPQVITPLEKLLSGEDLPTDEHGCLTLNVWTPACDHERRPVLVWVHGGAFATGTGRSSWYDGTALVRRGDVVVVTFNYRLGALGFSHGLAPGSGNLGLLDQVTALRWVRDHIAAFGGDPTNVTLFGESAGGASVAALLALPESDGLFHRAVAQSPSLTQLRTAERGRQATAELLALLGLSAEDADGLARLDVATLVEHQTRVLTDNLAGITAASPTADGEVLPATLTALRHAAAARRVPLLLGTTRDEMALFSAFDPKHAALDDAALGVIAHRTFGDGADEALSAYRHDRPDASTPQLAVAIATDAAFRLPAIRLAEARAAAGSDTWLYWFTWPTPAFGGVLGACHGIEIPFVFHNLSQPGVEMFLGHGPERHALADAVADTWLAFARHGSCPWPTYEPARRTVLRIDVERELITDPEAATRQAWDGLPAWP